MNACPLPCTDVVLDYFANMQFWILQCTNIFWATEAQSSQFPLLPYRLLGGTSLESRIFILSQSKS